MADDHDLHAELVKITQALESLIGLSGPAGEQMRQPLLARKAELDAQLSGSGAIAQNGSTAIGQQAIGVNGNVSNSVLNTGTLYQLYLTPQTKKPRLDEETFERILHNYLDWVRKAYGKARLYGLESIATSGSQKKRELTEIFIPLKLQRFSPPRRAEIEKHARNFEGDHFAEQKAFLALVEEQRKNGDSVATDKLFMLGTKLAVIGGAGSGKSTLLAYLAASLAEHELSSESLPFTLPKSRKTLVPLVIPLRYRREYLRLCEKDPDSTLKHVRRGTIAGFILWYLKKRSQSIHVADEDLAEEFFDRLLLGGGCLVMLDGLDEVVSQADRGHVKQEVERLADEIYSGNQFIVTARESGYKENAIFSDDFVRMDVQPLDESQIDSLVENWCEQLYPEQVETQKTEIVDAIRAINSRYESKNMPPLISTPLLTTMVVSVKWGEAELPRERARLYEAVIKVILQAQYLDDDPTRQELVNWGGLWNEQREWLSYLALEMQRGGQNGAAIPESRLREILSEKLSQKNLDQFILAVRSRGGLFEERAELFQFAHLTFQEFLAARLLAKDRDKSLPHLKKHIADAWWREVLLLVYGFAKQDYAPFATEYLDWLSTQEGELALAGLELAGWAVLEIERVDDALYAKQAERLVTTLTQPALVAPAILRARAGNTLAALGDPRFDPAHWMLPKAENFGFVHIPAGEFIMGSKPGEGNDKNETPQHKLTLPDYWIAKYPATVAQFRAFVQATGYDNFDKDALRSPDNHPTMWLTWYNALDYSEWLNKNLLAISKERGDQSSLWAGIATGKLHVTLPSEAEWEKASRGTDGRIYPWGKKFDPKKVNNDDAGIGTTSAVGCFPSGASPYGLFDMSGNVWEWTRNIFDEEKYKYPYKQDDGREGMEKNNDLRRVLRGGAFSHASNLVRCAFRYGFFPLNGDDNVGFRVVVVPNSSS
jgi:formylglycine-generating enzyme required for sulfatase activity